ncbi:hypothetical protein ACE1TI_06095 [Alteribacillus sp. JSM 102045]|uniref:hypothetical protein n=1 Tax=Alteribacillus sp. JSM 102045 TaxID=1562101 RepID=UPI0035BED4F4
MMKYWLVSAVNKGGGIINIKIENQSILYRGRHQYEKVLRVNAAGFSIEPAKVAIGGKVEEFCREGSNRKWTRMICKGITTSLLMMPILKREELEENTKEILSSLKDAPIDYILVPSIHSKEFTPRVVRDLKKQNYPVLEVYFTSLEECKYVPWDWIKQAVGPSSLSFVFRFPPPDSKIDLENKLKWEEALSEHFNVVTFESGAVLSKNEMQITGVYPRKGTIARGDADYLLYYDNERTVTEKDSEASSIWGQEPEIVVLRGEILKAGQQIYPTKGFGRCCNDLFPGRLRSINGV